MELDRQRIYIWGITGQSPGSSLSTICRAASRTSMAVDCIWQIRKDQLSDAEVKNIGEIIRSSTKVLEYLRSLAGILAIRS
jgi:hypothetical protein